MKSDRVERVMAELHAEMINGMTEGMDLKQMAAFRTTFDDEKGFVVEGIPAKSFYKFPE